MRDNVCVSKIIKNKEHMHEHILLVLTIVIKPGLVWWVDLRPGWPGGWTGPGKEKDQMSKNPTKPGWLAWLTRDLGDLEKPG